MQDETLSETAERFFSKDPYYYKPAGKPRLWIHDALHAILEIEPISARNEEKVAVYQAVLLHSTLVTRQNHPVEEGCETPTLDQIRSIVLPDVGQYLQQLAKAHGYKVISGINEQEIMEAYTKAQILYGLIKEHFGKPLGQIPVSELKATPTIILTSLVKEATAYWESARAGIQKYVPLPEALPK